MPSATPRQDPSLQFERLYREGWPVAYRSALAVLEDEDAAADAAQEVFRRLLENEQWQRVDAPKRYFRMAGRNEALRRVRNHQHIVRGVEVDELPSPLPRPDDLVEAEEFRQNLTKVLDCLPERCAEVTAFVVLCRWTHAEVATELEISIKAVEKQVARGRAHLARLLSLTNGARSNGCPLLRRGG